MLSKNKIKPVISVVIPAHNESQGIKLAAKEIARVLEDCEISWEMIVVDDGSCDETYQKIIELAATDPRIKGIALSRNFGKEGAMLAGLESSTGDAVILIDADLQHPPALIPEMIARWQAGTQIVHAVKRHRKTDSAAKKSSGFFY